MKELDIIFDTLNKLVKHFEEKGIVLMIAYECVENEGEDDQKTSGAFLSTNSKASSRALAIVDWAAKVERSINGDQTLNP